MDLKLLILTAYRAYERSLVKRPFVTQTLSAGALAAIADTIAQNIEKRWKRYEYSLVRTARFTAVILFWIAPITYRWFLLLERLKGTRSLLPLKRMLLDQFCAAPVFTFSFVTNLHVLEGNTPREAWNKAMQDIVPIMMNNYRVWPMVQLINFYLLPLRFRLVFVQFVGLFWNIYLSYATQSDVKQENLGERSVFKKMV